VLSPKQSVTLSLSQNQRQALGLVLQSTTTTMQDPDATLQPGSACCNQNQNHTNTPHDMSRTLPPSSFPMNRLLPKSHRVRELEHSHIVSSLVNSHEQSAAWAVSSEALRVERPTTRCWARMIAVPHAQQIPCREDAWPHKDSTDEEGRLACMCHALPINVMMQRASCQ